MIELYHGPDSIKITFPVCFKKKTAEFVFSQLQRPHAFGSIIFYDDLNWFSKFFYSKNSVFVVIEHMFLEFYARYVYLLDKQEFELLESKIARALDLEKTLENKKYNILSQNSWKIYGF